MHRKSERSFGGGDGSVVEDAVVDAAEAMTGFGEKNDIMGRCR